MMFDVRQATLDDIDEILVLFYETIQKVNIKDYTQEEVNEWLSFRNESDRWVKRIKEQYFIVAVFKSQIVGFASIARNGYLDLMFTHKNFQRKGVAKLMLDELECKATEQNNQTIYSDVSITALKFFSANGYSIEKQQSNHLGSENLINFRMIKYLNQ